MSTNQVQGASSAWSITSLVIGIASIFMGWTFLAPIAGIVVGVMAKGREPHARTMANWGIGLNVVMLVGSLLLWILFGGAILALLGIGAFASVS
ncbi:hypothetical protein [Agrococcus jejuensis]|uniref:DUF4190 domain-containing protein n=1 Tax=Agrococcus jejuensis TaxID=399736 RepID=A0A1G8FD12_9MICO|nr:hypothetical protein [Agrococcus jejuensis]SDH80007.1 hypothetical protein SAMN04489720_2431 [Agrococcus jejuensis]